MTTMKERMLSGAPYLADDDELVAERLRAARLVTRFNATDPGADAERSSILRELLGRLDDGATVLPPFRCDYGYPIEIGPRTFINYGAIVLDCAPVTIGSDVQIGPNVQILTATHPLDAPTRIARWESALPITIEDAVWLGGGVIVLPGVTIGARTVVGAGSVVTRELPPDVVAVGNPCRVVRGLASPLVTPDV